MNGYLLKNIVVVVAIKMFDSSYSCVQITVNKSYRVKTHKQKNLMSIKPFDWCLWVILD